jgi:hypothetical protein
MLHNSHNIVCKLVLYVPALHFSQLCAVPIPVANVPMGHGAQFDIKLILNIARYVPAAHNAHCVDPVKDA